MSIEQNIRAPHRKKIGQEPKSKKTRESTSGFVVAKSHQDDLESLDFISCLANSEIGQQNARPKARSQNDEAKFGGVASEQKRWIRKDKRRSVTARLAAS